MEAYDNDVFCVTHRAQWLEDVCDYVLQYPDGRECVESPTDDEVIDEEEQSKGR